MALITDLSNEPYFDDYNEDKNFHRVMFKPATAVQARELNQLQAILQNQIERFGENVLKEGTIIKGGNFVEEPNLPYVKLLDDATDASSAIVSADVKSYVGMKAVGLSTGIEAIIIAAEAGLESQLIDLNTIYVRYINNKLDVNSENINTFSSTEQIQIQQKDSNGIYQDYHRVTVAGATGFANPIGEAYGVRCGDGIIFQKGHFVRFADALTIVSKYSPTPTGVVVGFVTTESFVTSDEDESLLDNAAGFNNFNAPGADRLKLTPTLTVMTTTLAKSDETFFALQEYVNGKVVRRRLGTQFNSVESLVQQRTSEESGDYTVQDFPIRVEQSESNTANLAVVVGSGVAYVQGRRVELVNDIFIETSEASTTNTVYNQDVIANYGHFVTANAVTGTFPVSTMGSVTLANSSAGAIGSARIRQIAKNGSLYNMYVFDVAMNSGQSFENVRTVFGADANTSATLVLTSGAPTINDFSFKNVIFPIGRSFVKSVSASNSTDYVFQKTVDISSTSGGTITLSLADSAETFPYTVGSSLNSTQLQDLIIVSKAAVGPYSNNQIITPTAATVNSSQQIVITITAPGSTLSTTIYFKVKRAVSNANITRKLVETSYVKIVANTTTTGPWSLGLPDVYSIEGVWQGNTTNFAETNTNVTDYFVLDTGQNDNYYGLARLKLKPGLTLTSADGLLVKVKAFKKSGGINAFFTVDSYPVDDVTTVLPSDKIRTENIPTYVSENGVEYYMRDVIDIRPYATPTAAYATTIGTATTNPANTLSFTDVSFAVPNASIETTYDYYLGRKDIVIVNDRGDVQVIQGVATDVPFAPITPSRSMLLATLNIPPFPSLPSAIANRAKKPSYGVGVTRADNRRYTMRDVGAIDKRLKNLEYYTSLNLLEKSATDLIITDTATGLDKFKNGILVDNFENLMVADVKTSGYTAAIDPTFKEIHPRFRAYPIGLKVSSTSNILDYGKVATLTKSDTLVIEQPYATDTKSCTTSYYKYNGAMQLDPSNDSAPDYTVAPDLNIDIDLATPFMEFTEALSQFVPLQRVDIEVINNTVSGGFLGLFRRRTQTLLETTSTLTVTEGQTTTQDLGDFVTDVQFKPYLRSKNVKIFVTGLRPSTRYYFFFDGKDVNEHIASATLNGTEIVRSSDFSASNVITSDAEGRLTAIFRIPAETFFVGDRTLEVMDVPLYSSKEAASSYAAKVYSGFNFSVTKTGMAVSTRNADIDITTTTREIRRRRRGSDPIAQTFMIDRDLSTDDSVMVTKVDLFFARKSTVGNGVGVQIREVMNGYPSGVAVPFSSVHLNASEVIESSTTPTTFTFEAPVALKTDTEYALIVAPDANDPDYLIWIARTGNVDVDTEIAITQDTNAGVLFTSTNNKAWTPYQDENLKFNLYKATYNTSSGTMKMVANDPEFFTLGSYAGDFINDEYVFLANKPATKTGTITLTAGSNTVSGTSTAFLTDFSQGEYLVVKDATSGSYQVLRISGIANNSTMSVADLPTKTISGANNTNFWSSPVGRVSYFDKASPAILILEGSSAKSTLKFTANTTSNTVIIGSQSGATALVSEVKDLPVSYAQSSIYRSSFNTTRINASFSKLYDGVSTYSKDLDFKTNNYMSSAPTYIRSKSNEVDIANPTFEITLDLKSVAVGSIDVSPMIDHEVSNITAYEYFVNANTSGETTEFGSALSKYISKKVELADGLDATDVRTFLTAYRPPATDIKVYIKVQSTTDSRRFADVEWTELTAKSATNEYSSSGDRYDYREIEYELGTTAKTAGQGAWLNNGAIRYIDTNGGIHNSYKYFSVKIVMTSSSHNVVPRIADMRTLALT
jgi:Domain of unknown function (DUF4815)